MSRTSNTQTVRTNRPPLALVGLAGGFVALAVVLGGMSAAPAPSTDRSPAPTPAPVVAPPSDDGSHASKGFIVDGVTATIVSVYPIGQAVDISARAVSAGAVYSNITTFTGFGVTIGGADNTTGGNIVRNTRMLADDIQCAAGGGGDRITAFTFSFANFN